MRRWTTRFHNGRLRLAIMSELKSGCHVVERGVQVYVVEFVMKITEGYELKENVVGQGSQNEKKVKEIQCGIMVKRCSRWMMKMIIF